MSDAALSHRLKRWPVRIVIDNTAESWQCGGVNTTDMEAHISDNEPDKIDRAHMAVRSHMMTRFISTGETRPDLLAARADALIGMLADEIRMNVKRARKEILDECGGEVPQDRLDEITHELRGSAMIGVIEGLSRCFRERRSDIEDTYRERYSIVKIARNPRTPPTVRPEGDKIELTRAVHDMVSKGETLAHACAEHGISPSNYYQWKKKYTEQVTQPGCVS